MKKLLLILLCLPMIGFGQNVNIPDANFKAYLVGYSAINTNGDTEIQVSEATAFNGSIVCYTSGISDLTGIEAFTALNSLTCSGNALTSLDVSQNTALNTLNCFYNQLTSLDVSNNTALTTLDCQNNSLTSLSVSGATALTTLDCQYNNLTSLDVSQNTALTDLDCRDNQLTSLNLSGATALTDLNCRDNQLTSLNLSGATALTDLNCFYNQLTSLDVSNNVDLVHLGCNSNQLTSLDLSNNTALTYLRCEYNQLTSLDVSNNQLDFLFCSFNQIVCLDLSHIISHIFKIIVNDNQLQALNIKNGQLVNAGQVVAYNNNLTCVQADSIFPSWPVGWQFDVGVVLNTDCNYTNICNPSAIQEHTTNKELLKITDLLGRETKGTKNEVLFYIYDDGTVEKRIVIE